MPDGSWVGFDLPSQGWVNLCSLQKQFVVGWEHSSAADVIMSDRSQLLPQIQTNQLEVLLASGLSAL